MPRYRTDVTDLEPTSTRGASQSAHPSRLGHYRVTAVLGTGFTTNVYRAEAEGIGRVVVLKVLRSNAGRESAFFRGFEREARLLSSLRHPNLIELFDYDAGVAGERPPYMVLEHVEGATLRHVLERAQRLEPDEAAAIALEVARALAYAHAQGVVHRDVKPANVLVGRSAHRSEGPADDRVSVKVVDFGVAHERAPADGEPRPSSHLDGGEAGEALGTPAYMSPEQLLGEAIDHRSDQFALGIVLYQMLAGARPFDGDDGRPAIQRVRREPPRPFKSAGVAVPRGLERIVLRCLAKRPADRFERTDELVAELARFLEERVESVADLSALHRRVRARAGVLDERRAQRLLREEAPTSRAASSMRTAPMRVRAVPLTPTVLGIVLAALAMGAGGAAIQWRLGGIRDRDARPPASADPTAGEAATARLKVLVQPWADVIVDGRKVDTTPIGRPIALRPGRHVVVLEHPSATERRVVEIGAGQIVPLDVGLPGPAPSTADEFLPPSTSAAPSASAAPKPPAPTIPSSLSGLP